MPSNVLGFPLALHFTVDLTGEEKILQIYSNMKMNKQARALIDNPFGSVAEAD